MVLFADADSTKVKRNITRRLILGELESTWLEAEAIDGSSRPVSRFDPALELEQPPAHTLITTPTI
jgi:hypothetical protein